MSRSRMVVKLRSLMNGYTVTDVASDPRFFFTNPDPPSMIVRLPRHIVCSTFQFSPSWCVYKTHRVNACRQAAPGPRLCRRPCPDPSHVRSSTRSVDVAAYSYLSKTLMPQNIFASSVIHPMHWSRHALRHFLLTCLGSSHAHFGNEQDSTGDLAWRIEFSRPSCSRRRARRTKRAIPVPICLDRCKESLWVSWSTLTPSRTPRVRN